MQVVPNKIATRQWCKDTFGTGSLVYTGNSGALNECIHASDLNYISTDGRIKLPVNDSNGAIPSTYLANGTKCYTQDAISKLYQIIQINPLLSIIKIPSATGSVVTEYRIAVNITYYNEVKITTSYPGLSGFIVDGNGVSFNVIIKRFSKDSIVNTSPLATTTLSGMTLPYPSTTTSSSNVDQDVFGSTYTPMSVTTPTGNIAYDDFFNSYLADMYKYFNGETSNARYTVTASINTPAYIKQSTFFKPTYFELNPVSVVTSTNTNKAEAIITYNCTSNTGTRWDFEITITNKNSNTNTAYTSVTVDRGNLTLLTTTGTTTEVKKGYITYTPSNNNDIPLVTVTYAPPGYVPFKSTCSANVIYNIP